MSTADETPQQASGAAPAAPTANEKANEKIKAPSNRTSSGKHWTQAEKDAVIVQFLSQAAGKSFVPNFKTINAPGRTEKAVRHIWEALKKSYTSPNEVNAKDEADARASTKKRKAELEGKDEGAAKKKNKAAKKVTSETEAEENISEDSFSEVYRDDSIESENEAPALPDYEDYES